jgi:cystathionine beta-lyase/cystathionine gamma-synthase
MENFSSDYIINHLGENREAWSGAASPPVFMSSMFTFPDVESMRQALISESSEPFYTRGTNPGFQILEKKIAALEGGEAALLFASGSAAIAAAVCSQVKAGDHVICVEKPYSWTAKLLNAWLHRFGVETSFVDGSEASVSEAIRPETRILYLETPNSFTFELQDIAALARLVRPRGIKIIADNSYATPIFQKPIALGADMVVHSATKYFSGHSDALGGLLICSEEDREKIFRNEYMTLGATMSPMNAWLILRGLRTLPIRLKKSHETGMEVAGFLASHPGVKKLNYPFHPSHPQHRLAVSQMKGCGGLMSFELNSEDPEKIENFCNSLKYFLLACSWGSYESLCFPAIGLVSSANYSKNPFPIGLIRLYCGLEDAAFLIEDLNQAFIRAGIL